MRGTTFQGPIGLGFRRLSIIDLQSGHQPLSNEDGTIWIVFNGEIYNFQELRAFLLSKGHTFKTQSDTEVIVHLYEELGPQCLEKLRGMFAFAIWDENTKTLFLARDRVGIKPLYYCLTDESLVFASEIKAILADPSINREIAPEIIDRFLTFLYVPGEETLLKGISQAGPGTLSLDQGRQAGDRAVLGSSLRGADPEPKPRGRRSRFVESLGRSSWASHDCRRAGGCSSKWWSGFDRRAQLRCDGTDKEISSFHRGFLRRGSCRRETLCQIGAQKHSAPSIMR